MKLYLQNNFYKIQGKIEALLSKEDLHIKEIADLERYIQMQKNIAESLKALGEA
jgi:hypothetical protein